MYTEGFDQWFKMYKNLSTPVTEWNKATADIYRTITQQNLEVIEDNMSRISDQIKRFSNIKKPEDWVNLQKDCINEDMAATMEYIQKMSHLSMDTMSKITKMCGTASTSMSGNKSPDHSDR